MYSRIYCCQPHLSHYYYLNTKPYPVEMPDKIDGPEYLLDEKDTINSDESIDITSKEIIETPPAPPISSVPAETKPDPTTSMRNSPKIDVPNNDVAAPNSHSNTRQYARRDVPNTDATSPNSEGQLYNGMSKDEVQQLLLTPYSLRGR